MVRSESILDNAELKADQGKLPVAGENRLHRMGAADRLGASLRETQMAHLAGIDQFLDSAATSSIGTSGSTRCW